LHEDFELSDLVLVAFHAFDHLWDEAEVLVVFGVHVEDNLGARVGSGLGARLGNGRRRPTSLPFFGQDELGKNFVGVRAVVVDGEVGLAADFSCVYFHRLLRPLFRRPFSLLVYLADLDGGKATGQRLASLLLLLAIEKPLHHLGLDGGPHGLIGLLEHLIPFEYFFPGGPALAVDGGVGVHFIFFPFLLGASVDADVDGHLIENVLFSLLLLDVVRELLAEGAQGVGFILLLGLEGGRPPQFGVEEALEGVGGGGRGVAV
jgi:hypothetical protein